MAERLWFSSDYMEGAHPAVLKRLCDTNREHTVGYGLDPFCENARRLIRRACAAPQAEIRFLSGGTQANAVVIAALLRPYQGVLAAETGHIHGHEAGAIEHGGHKVLLLPPTMGKIAAADVQKAVDAYQADENRAHTVMPGMVYISQPTECGSLYSLAELTALSAVCRRSGMALYLDGARLAYALASAQNDLSLPDIARLCDVFTIGGTKCGALFGEAVVLPDPTLIPHFFTMIKQNGALLAKGRVLGVQFEALFEDGLYVKIGQSAVRLADRIRAALGRLRYRFAFDSPTNQIFIVLDNARLARLQQAVELGFWEAVDEGHTVVRICTGWATEEADVDRLIALLEREKED